MAICDRKCFVCNQVFIETPTDPKLSTSCGPRRRAQNWFILLQRALDLPALGADQSEIAHKISFCKPCLDELEATKNVLDSFDKLKKMVERHMKEIQLKFLESDVQEGQVKCRKDLELEGVAELRSQMVAGLRSKSRSRTAARTDSESSHTPGIFKRVTRTRTKPNNFPGRVTPSTPRIGSSLPLIQISSSSLVSDGVRNEDRSKLKGEAGFHNVLSKSSGLDDLNSVQGLPAPAPTTKGSRAGNRKRKAEKVFNQHSSSSSTLQLSPQKKPKSPSIPKIKPQTCQAKPIKNKKKYKCELCPARFNNKFHLPAHLRVHTGEKPFSCKLCPKSFAQMFGLKSHQLVHSGKKPFQCNFCSKKVARRHELKKHERVHTGEKPYLCKLCLKTFAQSTHLVAHMRTHTREKPYKCTTCSKEFAQKTSMIRHKKMRNHAE